MLEPFKCQDQHGNSPHWPPYNSWKIGWENLFKDQSIFPWSDHFINSHNLSTWLYTDVVWGKLMLITPGT